MKLQAISLAASLFGLALAAPATAYQALAPERQISSGALRGVQQGDIQAYLGIPYAAPPVGERRWTPPAPLEPWQGVRDATAVGDSCAQNADLGVFGKAGGSEDCLFLNVFVDDAAARSGEKLPVFVWIHGGSLWVGAGHDNNPAKLAADGKAVVVTLNYRLGLLGFFATPALDREGHRFANYGLMDQQFALQWVQQNIAAFGGDPDNVTISGESSGGNSVFAHMVSPGAAGLFQHAIVMSGGAVALRYPAFGAPKPLHVAEAQGAAYAQVIGCSPEDMVCLRAIPTERILATQTPYLINQAIIDGVVIPIHPADALRSGRFNRATLINGTTRDEGTFFAGFVENETGTPITAASYRAAMEIYFGANVDVVIGAYPVADYVTPGEAFSAAVTDMLFACPARAINGWVADKTPTYAYEFADRTAPSYLEPTTFALGAAHTYELSYLFPGFRGGGGLSVTLNPLQDRLSDQMTIYWTEASKAGEREAEWPRYTEAQDNYLSLVLPESRMTNGTFAAAHNCAFWDGQGIY